MSTVIPARPESAVRAAPPAGPAEHPSRFEQHGWIVPVLGVASTVAVFVAMVLLTWIAGGGTPFD